MNTVSLIVAFALFFTTGLRLWLNLRQQQHIWRHRLQVPESFAEHVSLEEHQKAAAYSLAKLRLGLWGIAVESLMLLFWLFVGGMYWLNSLALAISESALWSGALLILAYVVIQQLVELPLSVYRSFVLESRFGFNRSTPRTFALDYIKGFLLLLLLGFPLLLGILASVEFLGSWWWLAAWALLTGFALLISWAFPIWIAPWFNRFTPLYDADLRQRIDALLTRCGFSSDGVFVMDGSKRSSHGNAYFTGMGQHKRIVFFDTLLAGMEPQHVEAVLAHELGHFRHHHIRKGLLLSIALNGLGFFIAAQVIEWPMFYEAFGIAEPQAAAGLLLFVLASPLFTFALSPLGSALSRKHEYQADAYAAQQTRAEDLIEALIRLYRDNASSLTPDPVYSLFYDSHPPAALRVAALKTQGSTA